MRRSAFVLFLTRFALELLLFLGRLPRVLELEAHARALRPPGSGASVILTLTLWRISAIALASVALNAVFAWYAYKITSPKILPPPPAEPTPST
jgi:hypothetical protein